MTLSGHSIPSQPLENRLTSFPDPGQLDAREKLCDMNLSPRSRASLPAREDYAGHREHPAFVPVPELELVSLWLKGVQRTLPGRPCSPGQQCLLSLCQTTHRIQVTFISLSTGYRKGESQNQAECNSSQPPLAAASRLLRHTWHPWGRGGRSLPFQPPSSPTRT